MSKKVKISEEKTKRLETIAIIGLIIFALISYFAKNFFTTYSSKEKTNIIISFDGNIIKEIEGKPIDINVDNKFTLKDDSGSYNIIEIKDKKISCIEANCPDEICVSHGTLRNDIDNDMIICAPHKMVIQYK